MPNRLASVCASVSIRHTIHHSPTLEVNHHGKRLLISLRVIAILLVRAKKLVSVQDAPSALLRGEDKYPRMLLVLGLMEN